MTTAASQTLEPAAIESTRSLVAANVLTVILAIVFKWPLATLMLPYWVQSIVIGYYSRRRILELRNFSTEGLKIDGQAVTATEQTKKSTANFFAFHYGFFHFGYLVFLWPLLGKLGRWEWVSVAAAAISFVWNHRESYRRNVAADREGCPNIGTLMFLPYGRILPMHFTIILGNAANLDGVFAIVLFGALKTAADVLMHKVEHRVLRRVPQTV